MKLSQHGAELIASFEGFVGHPYRDAVGAWTIGYGSTRGVGPNSPHVTPAQALARMRREVSETYGAAVNHIGVPLTQNQFDALCSFVYNVGPGGVGPGTTIGKRLRAKDYRGAADALLAWDKAGGHRLEGLTRRRRIERALFLKSALSEKLPWLTVAERRWCLEYDRLKKSKRDVARRRVLRRVMHKQAVRIAVAARDDGGWDTSHRRQRFTSLMARAG